MKRFEACWLFCIYKVEEAGIWETERRERDGDQADARAPYKTDERKGKDRKGYERDKLGKRYFMLSYSK